MKPGSTFTGRAVLVAAAVSTLALVSWGFKQSPKTGAGHQFYNDTIPVRKNGDRDKKVRDLDEAIQELDQVNLDDEIGKAMQQVQDAVKNIDQQKLQAEVQKAMKEIDPARLKAEVAKAMKEVDMSKMQTDLANLKNIDLDKAMQEAKESLASVNWDEMKADQQKALDALKEIDFDQVQAQVNDAMKQVDMKKIQENINAAMKNVDLNAAMKQAQDAVDRIDWDGVKANIEKSGNVALDVDAQMEKIGPGIRESLDKAKLKIEKTKAELKEYKVFVDGLDRDGTIDKNKEYSIQYKDGALLINGKNAAKSVQEKYDGFLKKHPVFSIKKDADDFNIDLD